MKRKRNNHYPSSNVYPQQPQIADTFRKKNRKVYEETKNESNSNIYSLEDKRNHRSTREINEYLKEKKIKYKQNEETKQLEKNKKLFLRFKNLYQLNMKDTEMAKTIKNQMQINSNNAYNSSNNNNTNNTLFNKQKKLRSGCQINQIEERKDDKMNNINNK